MVMGDHEKRGNVTGVVGSGSNPGSSAAQYIRAETTTAQVRDKGLGTHNHHELYASKTMGGVKECGHASNPSFTLPGDRPTDISRA